MRSRNGTCHAIHTYERLAVGLVDAVLDCIVDQIRIRWVLTQGGGEHSQALEVVDLQDNTITEHD